MGTYVPGFSSVKGFSETVCTLMLESVSYAIGCTGGRIGQWWIIEEVREENVNKSCRSCNKI